MQDEIATHVSCDSSATIKLAHHVRTMLETINLDSIDHLLLLPHDDTQFNASVRSAFNLKIGSRRGAVIEGLQALEIITLYSMYAFSSKIIIGSLDLPHGRKLRNLLDGGLATEEELVNDVLLGEIGQGFC